MIAGLFVSLLSFTASASAHFTMAHLLVDGKDTGRWKHVLEVAGQWSDMANPWYKINPQYYADTKTTNITCGRSAFDSMSKTAVADVIAGETSLGFRNLNMNGDDAGSGSGAWNSFFHAGPGFIWLSKAPNDDLEAYHGEGDWFKVAYTPPLNNTHWPLHNKTEWDGFKLPKTTPPGKYLMRFEYLWPRTELESAQYFVTCALINVIGEGGGKPTEFYTFPGTGSWDAADPGILIPENQRSDWDYLPSLRLLEYKPPGGPVWEG